MSKMEPSIDPAQLLEHTGWMRHLARSLVGEDQAEDVVQQTWLAMLTSPPPRPATAVAWLATVVRRLAYRARREERRRRRREGRLEREERALESPGAALQRAELQKLIVSAVLDLDEPYRSTVILRYFEARFRHLASRRFRHEVKAGDSLEIVLHRTARLWGTVRGRAPGGGFARRARVAHRFPLTPGAGGSETSIMKIRALKWRRAGLLALWSVTAGLLVTGTGFAAPDDTPARSVENLRLEVSPNGRYLVEEGRRPFFYLGDTCWLLFQRLDHEELDEYLKDRAAKGFTVIQAYVLRGLETKHPDGNSSLLGATPFIGRDPARTNEEFFENVDYVVHRANELGLVMGLVTAKSWHVADHPEKVFDEANAYAYGRFLGERYKRSAVIWFTGGDSAPGKHEAVWVAMAKGLKEGSGGRHLVCYHGHGGTSSSMWFHAADWLDFNSIQSGHHFGSDSYAFVSKDYALKPAKPTVDMEPAYENHPTGADKPRVDAHKVRSQAYAAMLAGAAGHGYGSLDLFYFYKDGDGPFPKNGFQDWRTAIAYEGSRQVGLMRRLFEQRPWHRMVPDQSALASDASDGPYRLVAARAEDGAFVIAYTPHGESVSIHMSRLRGAPVTARWYDPRAGTWRAIGEYPNAGVQEFVAPSRGAREDWVLVLDAAP